MKHKACVCVRCDMVEGSNIEDTFSCSYRSTFLIYEKTGFPLPVETEGAQAQCSTHYVIALSDMPKLPTDERMCLVNENLS